MKFGGVEMVETNMKHVARIDYVDFFLPAFQNYEEARQFVGSVEASDDRVRQVLHQAARMIWLGDRLDEVAKGRPALQVLFYIIAAEAIAKIIDSFDGEGQSRAYVKKYFEEICTGEHKQKLQKAFTRVPITGADWTLENTIDFLYDVRCDVVHEGKYFEMTLKDHKVSMLTSWKDEMITAHITLEELRQIILEGAVNACKILSCP